MKIELKSIGKPVLWVLYVPESDQDLIGVPASSWQLGSSGNS